MRPLLLAFIVMMLSCKNPSQTLDIVNSRTHRIKLVQVTYPGGDHRITYSPTTGQLTNIATFDGVGLTYAYDGSLLKDVIWSGPVSGSVHKTYDSSFRLSSESVTEGQTINFGYDNDNLLTSAGSMTITRDLATGFVTTIHGGERGTPGHWHFPWGIPGPRGPLW